MPGEWSTELQMWYELKEGQQLTDAERGYIETIQKALASNDWKQFSQEINGQGEEQAGDLTNLQAIGLLNQDWKLTHENLYTNPKISNATRALIISIVSKSEFFVSKSVELPNLGKDSDYLSKLGKEWVEQYINAISAFGGKAYVDEKGFVNVPIDSFHERLDVNINTSTFWNLKTVLKEKQKAKNLAFSSKDNPNTINIWGYERPSPVSNYTGDVAESSKITSIEWEWGDPVFNVWTNFFDYNSAKIDTQEIDKVFNTETLNMIKKYLMDNPTKKMYITAYASSEWDAGYNQKLTEERAKNAGQWLEGKWIIPDRVVTEWKGKTEEFWPWPENYEKNRRITISFK